MTTPFSDTMTVALRTLLLELLDSKGLQATEVWQQTLSLARLLVLRPTRRDASISRWVRASVG